MSDVQVYHVLEFPLTAPPPAERTIDFLPYGTRTLKIKLTNPQRVPDVLVLRSQHVQPGFGDSFFFSHEEDGTDFRVSWGGGHERGACLVGRDRVVEVGDKKVRIPIQECQPLLDPAAETPSSLVYLNVTHTGGPFDRARRLLLVARPPGDALPGPVFTLPVRLEPPAVSDPLRLAALDQDRQRFAFAGGQVPVYLGRWWSESRVTFREPGFPWPELVMHMQDDSLEVAFAARPDAPIVKLRDHIKFQDMGEARDFDAELYHFTGQHYVLRLWFFWLWQAGRSTWGDEVPDAERFDFVIDAERQRVVYAATDTHWREVWAPAPSDGRPCIRIYRCTRAIPPDALDPDQFKRVKEFFAGFDALKGEHPGLYQSFDTREAFEKLVLGHLQELLLDYGDQLRGGPIPPDVVQFFAPVIPNNLPRRAAFFGRETEMDWLLSAIGPEEHGWGAVIDGIGGIGKTALAIEAAHRAQERGLFDTFIFVSAKEWYLAPEGIRPQSPAARSLDEFINETARVLGQTGIARLAGDAKRRALLDALRGTRALLIYDNLETLAKEKQEALADFLRFLPQRCKAILTSQRRGGEGALWLRLEKLEWAAARQIMEEEARKDERLRAKLESARGRWPALYDETHGSPLALVHVLGLLRVRATLSFDAALELLRNNRDPDLQKFIFREGRKELAENDVAALRALAFFVPSAPFEALLEVADLSRSALEMALDHLDKLAWLDRLEDAERYALHPLTRSFVRGELLADAQTARQMGGRFAKYWVAYANRYGWQNYQTYDRLEAEWANIAAAAEWLWRAVAPTGAPRSGHQAGELVEEAEGVGDRDAALLNDLAAALRDFLLSRGHWDERVRLSGRAYQAMRVLQDWSAAGWRAYEVAWIYGIYARNLPDQANVWAERCAEAWARGGSKREQAVGTHMRGLVARQRGDDQAAERLLQGALVIYRDLKLDEDIAIALDDLGDLERAPPRPAGQSGRSYRVCPRVMISRRKKSPFSSAWATSAGVLTRMSIGNGLGRTRRETAR